jgi:hypothetical protein
MSDRKPARLISATDEEGTRFPADQVAVSVDVDGFVSVYIPENDMPLHPRAVAIVAAAMKLEDDDFLQTMAASLN